MLTRVAMTVLAVLWIALVAVMSLPSEPAAADDDAKLRKAVRHIVGQIAKNDVGPRPGLSGTKAVALVKGSAHMVGQHVIPLSRTPYAPEGDWNGTVTFTLEDDEEAPLTGVDIALLCGTYDKLSMSRYLVVVGVEHGMTFEPDDAEEDLWYDIDAKERDVWISFGDELILIYVSRVEEE